MKKTSKLAAVLSSIMLVMGSSSAYAEQTSVSAEVYFVPMHFTFDKIEMAPPDGQRGFIYEGSTYVPLRFASYGVGKSVEWDQDTYTVTVGEPKSTDIASINEYLINATVKDSNIEKADISNLQPDTIDAYFEEVNYVFDGETKQPPEELPGMIYEDSLYVPMRFFSESVGKKIDWDQETYTVAASTSVDVTVDPAKPTDGTTTGETNGQTTTGTQTTTSGGGSVVIGGGGGGYSSGVNTSYKASIEAKYQTQAEQLQNRTVNTFYTLLGQYNSETDPDVKQQLKNQGIAQFNQVISEFNQIIANLTNELTENGFTTEKVTQMQNEFEQQKASGEVILCGSVGCATSKIGG
jgi:hypothetical protein